ncbi:MAG: hypothetical protein DI582_03300 [Azospirillum brasilense]|nr:MAG: hypothetical protein DI582_03300 [Azospirillum brasilense]
MMAFYSLLLILSAFVLSAGLGRVLYYVLKGAGQSRYYAPVATMIVMLGFLMVVSLPAGVLVAGWMLLLMAISQPQTLVGLSLRTVLPILIASTLGLIGLHESPGVWPSMLPVPVITGIVWLVFISCLMLGYGSRADLGQSNLLTAAALIPVALTPVLYPHAHISLAIDAAIIIAALTGGARTAGARMQTPGYLLLPVGLMVAYCLIQTVRYGAWPLAAAGLLIWAVGTLTLNRRERV